jgi:hypothetical protein
MKMIRAFLIFLVIQGLACFVAWCGGYDFNYRNMSVGLTVLTSLVTGAMVAGAFYLGDEL